MSLMHPLPRFILALVLPAALCGSIAQAGAAAQSADTLTVQAAQPAARPVVYMVRYSPGPNWEPGKSVMQQALRPHGGYMARLYEEGHIIAAGPLLEADGGLVLLRGSREDVEIMVEADPAVEAGIFASEIQPWTLGFGDFPQRAD